ncbi:Ger(x)C family spore germination protein [Metasolibacillus meyeri]|uniref:Ger(x)C family spore germination protein n=1 Tax=Metasolibacillus meyeri TaxID=1071052 RepID=UPI000D2FF23D|nr:Ger(x)C family spore germination protein [Metasolibacillus meyeri]
MKRTFFIIFLLLLIAGCAEQEQKVPIEYTDMIGIMAFDYIDEEKKKMTVAIPQYSQEAEESTKIFSVETDLVSQGIVKIERLSDRKIVLNQLRVILVSEEFAREGQLRNVIEHIYRNAEVGNKALIAIVKGRADDLIYGKYPDKPGINFYLNDLLLPTVNTAFNPNTNIHDFIYSVTNPVLDPIIPYLEKKDGKIEITGIALFKGDSMVQTIPPEDAIYIQAMQNEQDLSPLYIELPEDAKVLINLVKSKCIIKGNKDKEQPKLSIHLNIRGTLSEYKSTKADKINTWKEISELEKAINKQLEKDIKSFIEKLNEQELDPIGLSENFRKHTKGKWTREMTDEVISKLEVEVEVKTIIVSAGTLK